MAQPTSDRIVTDYLKRLEAAAAPLAHDRRKELVAEIREHIEASLAESGARSDADVRNVLERLGSPEEIAGAAGVGGGGSSPTRRAGPLEIAALLALLVPVAGWAIGGVLVVVSRAWSGVDKVVGLSVLLVVPLLFSIAVVTSSADGDRSPIVVVDGAEQRVTDCPEGSETLSGCVVDTEGGSGLGVVEVAFLLGGIVLPGLVAVAYLGWRLNSVPSTMRSAFV